MQAGGKSGSVNRHFFVLCYCNEPVVPLQIVAYKRLKVRFHLPQRLVHCSRNFRKQIRRACVAGIHGDVHGCAGRCAEPCQRAPQRGDMTMAGCQGQQIGGNSLRRFESCLAQQHPVPQAAPQAHEVRTFHIAVCLSGLPAKSGEPGSRWQRCL